MLKAIVVFSIAIFLAVVYAQDEVSFVIDVTGTFRETNPTCDYCDCPDIQTPCTFVDDFTCPDNTQQGADDNQVRWGTLANSNGAYFCFKSSGLGFQGKKGVKMVANAADSTIIGKITHYNNAINAGTNGRSSSPSSLRLKFTVNSDDLAEPFIITYPLSFIETSNTASLSDCDPAIQRSDKPCDDRLSFNAGILVDSFLSGNFRYTLSVAGFLNPGSTVPIKAFITKEGTASRANVYARIITFCEENSCGPNELFIEVPSCQCVCQLQNETCTSVFGDDWYVGGSPLGSGCSCLCGGDPNQCNASNPDEAWNPDRCACGCNLTDAYCAQQNPLFGVSLGEECKCECNKQKYIECAAKNPYYRPVGESCACECFLSDSICADLFGQEFGKYDEQNCACIAPPAPEDPDLTDAEIAGIVVATVVGSALIGFFLLAVLGVLIWLIMSGIIPGIYGYKIASADLGAGSVNPGYASPWSDASSALG